MYQILANDGIDKGAELKLISLGFSVDTNHYEGTELNQKIKEIDCIIIRSATKIRKPLIDEAVVGGKLKLIIRAGVGIDNIDHVYSGEQGIVVRNTPKSSSDAVAELAIGHMFALARHIYISNVTMRNGQWNKKECCEKSYGIRNESYLYRFIWSTKSVARLSICFKRRVISPIRLFIITHSI